MRKPKPIGNLLYTTEDESSVVKTKAELQIPDPPAEKALGVLTSDDSAEHRKDESSDESKGS